MAFPSRLIFRNPGLIDIEAILTFGVSVKESANPIGKFGTGFKYAVAAILRESGRCHLFRGKDLYLFFARPVLIRNKQFRAVFLKTPSGERIPCNFTTDLGKNWQPWMAIRELYSNMLDEGGDVLLDNKWNGPQEEETQILLEGTLWTKLWMERHTFILQSEPIAETPLLDVHAGESHYLFFNGLRVYKSEKLYKYTYNFKYDGLFLTEDRTIAYPWQAEDYICQSLLQLKDKKILYDVLAEPAPGLEYAEHEIKFGENYDASDEALDVIRRLREPTRGAPHFSSSYYGYSGLDRYYKRAKQKQISTLETESLSERDYLASKPIVTILVDELKLFDAIAFTRGLDLSDGYYWDTKNNYLYFPLETLHGDQAEMIARAFGEYLKHCDETQKGFFVTKMATACLTAYLKG
jgi:hypothetical protein